ncbi:hypothetical protein ABFS82_11G113700 [Erythranthe guttata]
MGLKYQWVTLVIMIVVLSDILSLDNFGVAAADKIWKPMGTNNPRTLEYGRYAVREVSRLSRQNLVFVSVVEGQSHAGEGKLELRFTVNVKKNNVPEKYNIRMYDEIWNGVKKVTMFMKIN